MDRSRRKTTPIARKRRNFVYLLLAVLAAIITAYIFLNYPPDYSFQLSNFGIPVFPLFIASFVVFLFSTLTFLFIQKIQGILVTSFVLIYLFFRLFGLTHWIFAFLFLALFVTLEVVIAKQK